MDNTIDVITHNQCTGCGACYNKCPVNAIVMKPDAEGFFFPSINSEHCIHCGLCLKTCPVFETKYENNPEPKCYAVMADDEKLFAGRHIHRIAIPFSRLSLQKKKTAINLEAPNMYRVRLVRFTKD